MHTTDIVGYTYAAGQYVDNVDFGQLGISMDGESGMVQVREVYGQWEDGGPTMLSIIDQLYGREHDVSADDLKEATG
jgi:hypothetical protein